MLSKLREKGVDVRCTTNRVNLLTANAQSRTAIVRYAEDESRLSDITLQWMAEQATGLPHPLQVDRAKLNMFPDAGGMQHCEVTSMKESHEWAGRFLDEEPRKIDVQAVLHPTVMTRMALPSVLHYGARREYRPSNLNNHTKLGQYFNKKSEVSC